MTIDSEQSLIFRDFLIYPDSLHIILIVELIYFILVTLHYFILIQLLNLTFLRNEFRLIELLHI